MKCSIIERSTICFDHLTTPLQHSVDQSLYATLIQVGPCRPSAKCAGIPPKRYRPSPSCWLSAWCYPRGSWRGCSREDLVRHSICSMPFSSRKAETESATRSTMRSCIVVYKDKLVFGQFLEENGIERIWNGLQGVARWSKQMVDLSIIEHFIHCDAY